MWFRSVGRVVWVGNADGRGCGVGGGGGDGLGEDGVPEKRERRDIGRRWMDDLLRETTFPPLSFPLTTHTLKLTTWKSD